MARDVLVLGGTRFFGKKLVSKLIKNGDRVTVASRDPAKAGFGSLVKTAIIDRDEASSMRDALHGRSFDLVYDQICYSPSAAHDLCRILSENARRIIFTSSQSIYMTHDRQRETDFDATKYPIKMGWRSSFDYGEGKRLAEAVYAQRSGCPVASIRFPFVMGTDDYTGRLDFHVERIAKGRSIVAQNPRARTSFIHADEAADFLFWVGQNEINGPINACSLGEISLLSLVHKIEAVLGKQALLKDSGPQDDVSPYAQVHSRYLDCSKAQMLGFVFSRLDDWLTGLIEARVRVLS